MKILIMTGTLLPLPGNNTNLICKLIPILSNENEVHIIAPAFGVQDCELPKEAFGVPVHWIRDKASIKHKLVYPTVSKLIDPNGFSDALLSFKALDALEELHKYYAYDVIITTMEPYYNGCACSKLSSKVKKIVYIMDPPAAIVDEYRGSSYRNSVLNEILKKTDKVFTTESIIAAFNKNGYDEYGNKFEKVGFPMIRSNEPENTEADFLMDENKINLLFCGWLYSDIRSPKFFLDIISRLDERYCIYFMGKECDKLFEKFEVTTKAKIITLPQQPYSMALKAMQRADVLINIGNSVSVHMPSKTLEYINTGKAIVSFYKREDCPTLYYTKRYPLCLNIFEDEDVSDAEEEFAEFCENAKGNRVDRNLIKETFYDCTPEYIAEKMLEELKKIGK